MDGCERRHESHGLCGAHNNRRRRGKPLSGPIRVHKYTPRGAPLRFIEEVALVHTGDDCLPWPFGRGGAGYGLLNVDGRAIIASRYVCKRAHGDPPDDSFEASHSCSAGHEGCVNPHHVSWKTPLQNAQDKIDAGNSLRGELNPTNVLTTDQVREILRLKGTIGAAKIGARFGVCETTVLNIHRRRKWAWLEA